MNPPSFSLAMAFSTLPQLVAWVRIPSLSAVTDTEIYMYYGNAGASNQENVTDVWDANFKMVQHMDDNPNTSSTTDSTSNNNDGAKLAANNPLETISGKAGDAQVFAGDDYITKAAPSFIDDTAGSVEQWVKFSDLTQSHTVVNINVEGAFDDEFLFMYYRGSVINYKVYAMLIVGGVTSFVASSDANLITDTDWHHWVVTSDSSTLRFYLDGVEVTMNFTTGANSGQWMASATDADILSIGAVKRAAPALDLKGTVDEVRISDTARSADWIQTSYNNQSNPSDFITLGLQETELTAPTVTTAAATSVEETTATLNGTLTDDGGEGTQYRFEYDTDSGAPYSSSTSWSSNITSVQSFSTGISSLSKGTKYYFRAQAKNSVDTSSGSELTFLTKPDEPTALSATAISSSRLDLSWTKGAGANNTMVRRKQGSHPTSISDGSEVYFSTGTSTSDTSLSADTTYFYSAWSEVSGSQQYSDAYATANATTSAAEAPTAIGGEVFPVDKPQVLAPWLFLFLMLSLATTGVACYLRKRA